MSEMAKPFCIREHLRTMLNQRLPDLIDETPTPTHQYAVAYPETYEPGEIPRVELRADEEEAQRQARALRHYANLQGQENEFTATVLRRSVTYGPWEVVTA